MNGSALPLTGRGRPPQSDEDGAERIRRALQDVIDPEAGVSVVELGLIHDITVVGGRVTIEVFIPTADCPFLEYLMDQIRRKVKMVNGTESVKVTLLDGSASVSVRQANAVRRRKE